MAGVCTAGYSSGTGIQSCRKYDRDLRYSKVYCDVDRAKLAQEKPPKGWTDDAIVGAPTSCIGYCFGDFIKPRKRLRKRYKKVYENRHKLKCCLGDYTSQFLCHPTWCWENENCDDVLREYCQTAEGQKDKRCGCLLPASAYAETKLLGPPECVDLRCAGNPAAYRTKRQRETVCPDIVNCVMGDIIIDAKDSKVDIDAIEQICGKDAADELRRRMAGRTLRKILESPWTWAGVGGVVVMVVIILVVWLVVRRKKRMKY